MARKSKFADDLRRLKVYNNWEVLRRFGTAQDVVIEYKPAPEGRLGYGTTDKTLVWSPRPNPHLKTPEQQRRMTSSHAQEFVGTRKATWPVALKWAYEHFPDVKFVPSPFGGHLPKRVVDAAKKAVDQAAANGWNETIQQLTKEG
jgi:hypothetical protein